MNTYKNPNNSNYSNFQVKKPLESIYLTVNLLNK